jgi:threonine/homoserine/homoserine lactone efflux protein
MVYFAALRPQFVDRSAGHVPLQLLLLGGIFIAIALISNTAWELAAGASRSWLARSPRRLELIGGQWPRHDRYRRTAGPDRAA